MGIVQRVVATCGNGAQGRLGHGLQCRGEQLPRIVASLVGHNIKAVACGGAHTVCLTEDGTVHTFGMNDQGQLGHSELDKFVAVPLEVGLTDPVVQIAAGDHHTLCLTSTDEVWAWGSHASGQLGIGPEDTFKHCTPRLVKHLSGAGVMQLVGGAEHSLALGNGGKTLWAWGGGGSALGLGEEGVRSVHLSPRQLRGPLDGLRLLQIAAGLYTSGAVDDRGRAWTWGHGTWHQLGHGDRNHETLPRHLERLTNVGSLALGHQHAWAALRDGHVWGWGTDDMGSMGQGDGHWQKVPITTPLELTSLPRVKSLAAGWKHTVAIDVEGRAMSWGWGGAYNSDLWGGDSGAGQLGTGTGKDHWEPTAIQRLHTSPDRFYDLRMSYVKPWKVLQAACGRNHTALLVQVDLDARDVA